MKSLRIVFMGTPEFAVPSLKKIANSHHQIVGVVTQPDRPRGRGLKLHPPPVKQAALELGLSPILQPEDLNDPQFLETLRTLQADVFVVVAFRILPEAVFTMPPLGTVNLHPSLLPKYRGAAPINWTIIQGETVTGVTTIFIQKKIDAGNIILQKTVPVKPDETAGELHDRLAEIGAQVLLETLDLLASGKPLKLQVQDENAATKAPKLNRTIAHLNFDQPAPKVKQWILGLSPVPGAYAFWRNKMIKLYRAQLVHTNPVSQKPGTIVAVTPEAIHVACNPGVVAITELQPEGKKRMSAAEFIRGYAPRKGDVFNGNTT